MKKYKTARYLKANTAGSPSPCPAQCRRVHLCAIPNVDITFFNKCVSLASGQQVDFANMGIDHLLHLDHHLSPYLNCSLTMV